MAPQYTFPITDHSSSTVRLTRMTLHPSLDLSGYSPVDVSMFPLTVGPYMTARCPSPLSLCMMSGIEGPPETSGPDCIRRMERTGCPVDIDHIPYPVGGEFLPFDVAPDC